MEPESGQLVSLNSQRGKECVTVGTKRVQLGKAGGACQKQGKPRMWKVELDPLLVKGRKAQEWGVV